MDEPAENALSTMSEPEGVNLAITRDLFGKPKSLVRSGSNNGYTVSSTSGTLLDGCYEQNVQEPEKGDFYL